MVLLFKCTKSGLPRVREFENTLKEVRYFENTLKTVGEFENIYQKSMKKGEKYAYYNCNILTPPTPHNRVMWIVEG